MESIADPETIVARTVFRITAGRHADRAFDGEGARLYGGRWNHPGTAVVYTSGTLSLAVLELFVHIDPDTLPDDLVAISAAIPLNLVVDRIEVAELPADWRRYPGIETLKSLGSDWVRSATSAVLSVPSAVIPTERNLLLNPLHPDFRKVRRLVAEPFAFDPRMWK